MELSKLSVSMQRNNEMSIHLPAESTTSFFLHPDEISDSDLFHIIDNKLIMIAAWVLREGKVYQKVFSQKITWYLVFSGFPSGILIPVSISL